MCIFAIGLFDKLKKYKFSSFSYFAKKVSGHDICCVPFSESACKTEHNDTKYDIEFRILSIRKMPWTTQSLNLAPDVEAWCTVRPVELSVRYETWPPIGSHHTFVTGWSKYRLGLPSAPLHYGLTWPVGFPPFFKPQWQSLCTALTTGKCLSLGLCKGTVKESTLMSQMHHTSLQLHHNLFNCWFRWRSKKTSKLHVTGIWAGNSPVTSEFPTQKASNAEMFPFDDVIIHGSSQWLMLWLLGNTTACLTGHSESIAYACCGATC